MLRDRWFLVGLLVIALSAGSAFAIGTAIRRNFDLGTGAPGRPERRPSASHTTPRTVVPQPSPGSRPPARVTPTPLRSPADPRSAAGWQMLTAGRLREAQEEFLQLLLTNPSHRDAMLGLVTVRRRLAGDDPTSLRRQAAAYQQAIARRSETEEHFTVEAMALLAQANLIAAEEIEAERAKPPTPAAATPGPPLAPVPPTASPRSQSPQTATPRAQASPPPSPRAAASPTPRPARQSPPPIAQVIPTPAQRSAPPTPRATATATPAAAPVTPSPQSAEQPVDAQEPFLVVRIGPVSDVARVSEIVGELTLSGYSAGVSRRDEPLSFLVVSETLARQTAERRAQVLAGYGFRSRLIALSGGLVQLEFGVFQSADAAEALAIRIRTRGYHAGVVREGGTGYLITAGPYRQTVANAVVRLVRTRFGPGLGVSVSAAP